MTKLYFAKLPFVATLNPRIATLLIKLFISDTVGIFVKFAPLPVILPVTLPVKFPWKDIAVTELIPDIFCVESCPAISETTVTELIPESDSISVSYTHLRAHET